MTMTQSIRLIIKLWHDDCPDNPNEYDGWKAYSFSRRHANNADPLDIGFDEDEDGNLVPDEDLKAKLESGLAHLLSYYEHGNCLWSLQDSVPPGANCPWDSVRMAGIVIWEADESDNGNKTWEDRHEDAKAFIDRFTNWCNGEVYGYTVEAVQKCCECGADKDAEHLIDFDLPSCGGYYGDDIEGMVIDMKDQIGPDWKDYDVTFEAHPYVSGLDDECKRLWKGE